MHIEEMELDDIVQYSIEKFEADEFDKAVRMYWDRNGHDIRKTLHYKDPINNKARLQ